jgi:hypothetical protein
MALRHGFGGAALNAGVLVLDLDRMRGDDFTRRSLALVERYGLHDQDAMLAYVGPDRAVLDSRWNALPVLEDVAEPALIHWAAMGKPWNDELAFGQALWHEYAIGSRSGRGSRDRMMTGGVQSPSGDTRRLVPSRAARQRRRRPGRVGFGQARRRRERDRVRRRSLGDSPGPAAGRRDTAGSGGARASSAGLDPVAARPSRSSIPGQGLRAGSTEACGQDEGSPTPHGRAEARETRDRRVVTARCDAGGELVAAVLERATPRAAERLDSRSLKPIYRVVGATGRRACVDRWRARRARASCRSRACPRHRTSRAC